MYRICLDFDNGHTIMDDLEKMEDVNEYVECFLKDGVGGTCKLYEEIGETGIYSLVSRETNRKIGF